MQAYLNFLNLDGAPPVTLDGLTQLTRAQVRNVPFESISSILRRAQHPHGLVPEVDTDAKLAAWVGRRGGGVCFEVVATFEPILRALGFQVRAINAEIGWPGSHQALVVDLGQSAYLVDVGNGAPFLEPIPLDRTTEVRHAGLAYRFHADAPDSPDSPSSPDFTSVDWIQDRWIDEAWVPFCRYTLGPADRSVRESAYQHHHTLGHSWVVDTLTLTRCGDDEVWSLRNAELRHFTPDGKSVQTVSDAGEYTRLATEVFGVPGLPIEAARSLLVARGISSL